VTPKRSHKQSASSDSSDSELLNIPLEVSSPKKKQKVPELNTSFHTPVKGMNATLNTGVIKIISNPTETAISDK